MTLLERFKIHQNFARVSHQLGIEVHYKDIDEVVTALDALAAVEKEREELRARLASVERVVEAARELFKDGAPVKGGFSLKMTDPIFKDRVRRLYASLPPSGEGKAKEAEEANISPERRGLMEAEARRILDLEAQLSASTAREAGLRAALEDSNSLLRSVRDENDEGGIAQQIKDNEAALAAADSAATQGEVGR